MQNRRNIMWTAIAPSVVLLVAVVSVAIAGQVTVPHSFQPNTTANAYEVNACLGALATEVNDNDSRIASALSRIGSLESQVDALSSKMTGYEQNGGIVMAAVHVNVYNQSGVQIGVGGFNNLPGQYTPTVTRNGTGQYEIDFGTSLTGYNYVATAGTPHYLITPGQTRISPAEKYATVSQTGSNSSKLWVTCYNDAGNTVDCPVFVVIF